MLDYNDESKASKYPSSKIYEVWKRKGEKQDENRALELLTMILFGLQHIHDQKITHRDLKPMNIFIGEDGLLKIGDFGISKDLSIDLLKYTQFQRTTLYFMAPEQVNKTVKKYGYFPVDIWSLGVIFYYISSMTYPFDE